MKKEIEDYNVNLFIEIDPEKKVVYISDYSNNNGGGKSQKYRTKKDISKIFSNYLINYVNLYYPEKKEF